jgi:hypothetical protein
MAAALMEFLFFKYEDGNKWEEPTGASRTFRMIPRRIDWPINWIVVRLSSQ